MKSVLNIIEGLKIKSNTKVQSDVTNVMNCLHCSESAARSILDKYVKLDILSKDLQKKMICSDFEALFMLASMLVDDKKDPDTILELGTVGYSRRNKYGRNPYDYSWFEEWYDEDNDIDVLDQIKNEYKSNKKLKNKFIEIFNFCKENNITEADDVFAYCDEVNVF